MPGDEIVTECVYETANRNRTTFSGLPTSDEMCLTYIDYYPAVFRGFLCVSSPQKQLMYDALGYHPENIPDLKHKSKDQYLREDFKIDWTPDRVKQIQDVSRNGQHDVFCVSPPADVVANGKSGGFNKFVQNGYPKVTDPLKPPKDECDKKPHDDTSRGSNTLTFSFAVLLFKILLDILKI